MEIETRYRAIAALLANSLSRAQLQACHGKVAKPASQSRPLQAATNPRITQPAQAQPAGGKQ